MNLSSISYKLSTVTHEIFYYWSGNVLSDHPGLNLTIKDRGALVDDLVDAINGALNNLFDISSGRIKTISNENINFFLNYINEKLNFTWSFDYITKQSNYYKEMQILKSVRDFFQNHESGYETVSSIYDNYLMTDVNLNQYDKKIREIELDIDKKKIYDFPVSDLDCNPVKTLLNNIINRELLKIYSMHEKNYMPDLDEFFTKEEIKYLIQDNLT